MTERMNNSFKEFIFQRLHTLETFSEILDTDYYGIAAYNDTMQTINILKSLITSYGIEDEYDKFVERFFKGC